MVVNSTNRSLCRFPKVTSVFRNIHRLHPVQHDKYQYVQGEAVEGKHVPARSIGKHHSRDREDDPLRQAHSLVSSRGFSAFEGGEWGKVRFVGGAVPV